MKNVFVVLSVVLALSACSSDSADYILNDSAFCSGMGNNETMICKDKNNKQINGHIIEYFPSGKIHRDFSIKDGIPDGIAKVFYENGKRKQQMNYKSGKLEGPARAWNANGKIQSECHYKNGIYDGMRKEYDENGMLQYEMPYTNGKLDGVQKEFTKEGKILAESTYEKGQHILTKVYDKDGKLQEEDNGLTITKYDYNEYGILVSKVEDGIIRKDTPKEQIQAQCKKYIDACAGDTLKELKRGCKMVVVHRMVVSKNAHGIQLDGVPNVIIKTKVDYNVGDMYVPTTYVEYVKSHIYRPLKNLETRIDMYEFKETNLPICE